MDEVLSTVQNLVDEIELFEKKCLPPAGSLDNPKRDSLLKAVETSIGGLLALPNHVVVRALQASSLALNALASLFQLICGISETTPCTCASKALILLTGLCEDPFLRDLLVTGSTNDICDAIADRVLKSAEPSCTKQYLKLLKNVIAHRTMLSYPSERYCEMVSALLIPAVISEDEVLLHASVEVLSHSLHANSAFRAYIKDLDVCSELNRTMVAFLSKSDVPIIVHCLSSLAALVLCEPFGQRLFEGANMEQTVALLFDIVLGEAAHGALPLQRCCVNLMETLISSAPLLSAIEGVDCLPRFLSKAVNKLVLVGSRKVEHNGKMDDDSVDSESYKLGPMLSLLAVIAQGSHKLRRAVGTEVCSQQREALTGWRSLLALADSSSPETSGGAVDLLCCLLEEDATSARYFLHSLEKQRSAEDEDSVPLSDPTSFSESGIISGGELSGGDKKNRGAALSLVAPLVSSLQLLSTELLERHRRLKGAASSWVTRYQSGRLLLLSRLLAGLSEAAINESVNREQEYGSSPLYAALTSLVDLPQLSSLARATAEATVMKSNTPPPPDTSGPVAGGSSVKLEAASSEGVVTALCMNKEDVPDVEEQAQIVIVTLTLLANLAEEEQGRSLTHQRARHQSHDAVSSVSRGGGSSAGEKQHTMSRLLQSWPLVAAIGRALQSTGLGSKRCLRYTFMLIHKFMRHRGCRRMLLLSLTEGVLLFNERRDESLESLRGLAKMGQSIAEQKDWLIQVKQKEIDELRAELAASRLRAEQELQLVQQHLHAEIVRRETMAAEQQLFADTAARGLREEIRCTASAAAAAGERAAVAEREATELRLECRALQQARSEDQGALLLWEARLEEAAQDYERMYQLAEERERARVSCAAALEEGLQKTAEEQLRAGAAEDDVRALRGQLEVLMVQQEEYKDKLVRLSTHLTKIEASADSQRDELISLRETCTASADALQDERRRREEEQDAAHQARVQVEENVRALEALDLEVGKQRQENARVQDLLLRANDSLRLQKMEAAASASASADLHTRLGASEMEVQRLKRQLDDKDEELNKHAVVTSLIHKLSRKTGDNDDITSISNIEDLTK